LGDKTTWGNLTMSVEDWEALNGYAELFDGAKCLEDCDMEFRIGAKDGNKDGIQLVLPHFKRQTHLHFPLLAGCLDRSQKCVQLCFNILRKRDKRGMYQANKCPLDEKELGILQECAGNTHPHICPYVQKQCKKTQEGVGCRIGSNKEIVELNNHPSLYFDLAEQRKDPEAAIVKLEKMVGGQNGQIPGEIQCTSAEEEGGVAVDNHGETF
jgi:hypothetical protein